MKLRFVKNGTLYDASEIKTPAGTFSGKELFEKREDLRGQQVDTTLSWYGYQRLKGDLIDDGEVPVNFHILLDGWGWCPVIL